MQQNVIKKDDEILVFYCNYGMIDLNGVIYEVHKNTSYQINCSIPHVYKAKFSTNKLVMTEHRLHYVIFCRNHYQRTYCHNCYELKDLEVELPGYIKIGTVKIEYHFTEDELKERIRRFRSPLICFDCDRAFV